MKKKDNLEEFSISPYYKGLLFSERVPGTSYEAESTNQTADDFQNLYMSSPYYKGLLFKERATGTSSEAESTNRTMHDFQSSYLSSPYYKGLLYTEKVAVKGTTVETESTTGGIIPHELMININSYYSPYYRGLLNQSATPDRESVAATFAGSSSSASFSVRGFIRKTFNLKETKEEVVKDDNGGSNINLMIEKYIGEEFEFGPIEHPIEPCHEDRPIKFPMPHSFYLINDERKQEYQFSNRKIRETQMVLHKEEPPVIMVHMRPHDHTNAIIPVMQTPTILAHMHQNDG